MKKSKLTQVAYFFLAIFFILTNSLQSQSIEEGEKLFKSNCVSCHQIDKKVIGPALRGVNDKYSQEWLLKWIKNSAELIASGDPDAIAIYEEYNKSAMSAFTYLSDEDILNILAYVEVAPEKVAAVNVAGASSEEVSW